MSPAQPTLLVMRFSAMGDVAMVASVLRDFSQQHPDVRIVMVSRQNFQPFFDDLPNLQFHALQQQHRGAKGIYQLFKALVKYRPTAVADLHYSIRSRYLSLLFRLRGIPVKQIDKGNKDKKAMVRAVNKVLKPLKPTVERYADVFRNLGFPVSLKQQLERAERPIPETAKRFFADKERQVIGISPFAQHASKIFPYNKMETVIAYLVGQGHTVLLFGGGATEKLIAEEWQRKYEGTHSLIGNFSLAQELAIISRLHLMISMDSAGMHMASLMGVRTVSIWGGTHPYAGFLGYGQHLSDCIQVDHPNRPSSIYGNKPCICDGVDAIDLVTAEMVIEQVKKVIEV